VQILNESYTCEVVKEKELHCQLHVLICGLIIDKDDMVIGVVLLYDWLHDFEVPLILDIVAREDSNAESSLFLVFWERLVEVFLDGVGAHLCDFPKAQHMLPRQVH
jgi:hypothetical protein